MADLGALMALGGMANAAAQGIDKNFQLQMQELRQKRLEEIENRRLDIAEQEAKSSADYRAESLRVDKVAKEREEGAKMIQRFMGKEGRTGDSLKLLQSMIDLAEFGEPYQVPEFDEDGEPTGETRDASFDEMYEIARMKTEGIGAISDEEKKDIKVLIEGLHKNHQSFFPDSKKTAMEIAASYPTVMYQYGQQYPAPASGPPGPVEEDPLMEVDVTAERRPNLPVAERGGALRVAGSGLGEFFTEDVPGAFRAGADAIGGGMDAFTQWLMGKDAARTGTPNQGIPGMQRYDQGGGAGGIPGMQRYEGQQGTPGYTRPHGALMTPEVPEVPTVQPPTFLRPR